MTRTENSINNLTHYMNNKTCTAESHMHNNYKLRYEQITMDILFINCCGRDVVNDDVVNYLPLTVLETMMSSAA